MRKCSYTGTILIAVGLTLLVVLVFVNAGESIGQVKIVKPDITATPLPPVDPTPIGGPISVGRPLPIPPLADLAIGTSNLDHLVEMMRLGEPTNLGISDLAFARDGKRLVAIWGDLVVWQMPEGEQIHSIPVATTHWTPLAISPDGRFAALGNHENEGWVELWNITTQERARQHRGGQQVRALGFNISGTLVAAGRSDGSATVWDVETGSLLHELGDDGWSGCMGMAFHPKHDEIAASSANNVIRIWDARSGQFRGELSLPNSPTLCGLSSLAYRPDGEVLAAALFWEHLIALWQGDTFVGYLSHPNAGRVWKIGWSPDGRLLAAAEIAGPQGGQNVLWDVQERRVAHVLDQWRGEVTFSPDGALLVTEGLEDSGVTARVLTIRPYDFFLPLISKDESFTQSGW